MTTLLKHLSFKFLAVVLFVVVFRPLAGFSQVDEAALKGEVDSLKVRTSTLESTVAGMAKLKITGYVQPQWNWVDGDSLANQVNSRNAFSIRRGRVKFTHTSHNISAVIYPDITENGVILKEVYATWNAIRSAGNKVLGISMGAMNRPFGYEIGYSSGSREVTERSLAENRLFSGERDLGLQLAFTPTFADLKPAIEIGIFNGSDAFGTGPVGALSGANNKMGFGFAAIGTGSAYTIAPGAADSAFKAQVNAALTKEGVLALAANGVAIGQPAKELIGHLRLPFLISDDFSFDIGGSISMGGITEPSNVIGTYTGVNGAIVLANSGTRSGHAFNNQNHVFMETNRSVIGADAQFYLSFLPIGGTILKGEMYTGQVPFYGSAFLFTAADVTNLGAPLASTIYKKVFGFYGMLVQNLTEDLQLAFRYEAFDPNTEVTGENFVTKDGAGKVVKLLGVTSNANFGGDLKISTISVDLNIFISGAMRLMLDWDHPMTEQYARVDPNLATNIQEVGDAHDDRFTFRMQYKF